MPVRLTLPLPDQCGRKFIDRKLSGKNKINIMQMQNTSVGTSIRNKPSRSNRKCMKYATISAALISDKPEQESSA